LAAPAVVTAALPGVSAPPKNDAPIEAPAVRPESTAVRNPWSQAANAGNETMDVDEISVMAEFPPLNRETSLSRAENSRRRRNEDQNEIMQIENDAVRGQNERERQSEQAKRPDLRARIERARPRAPTFKDYSSPVIEKLGDVERRIAENKIRPGFLRVSRNEDEKIYEYFERMTPAVGDKVVVSYKTSDNARNSNVCLRVSENTMFIFVKNWTHPTMRSLRSNAKYVFIESEILIVDPGFKGIHLPDENSAEGRNPRSIYPELYGEVKLYNSKHNGGCTCYSSMLLFTSCSIHSGICMKREYEFNEKNRSILAESSTELGRSHRIYMRSSAINENQAPSSFVSLVPPPFLLFSSWEDRVWRVPFSDLPPSDPLVKFLSSYGSSGVYMKKISEIYKKKPSSWGMLHPLLGQPGRNTELYELTKHLHSSEGLYRVSFVAHPLVYETFSLASTRDETLRIKECKVEKPGDIEDAIICSNIDYLLDDKEESHTIHCCECVPTFSANGSVRQLQRFNRQSFVAHYEAEHYGSSVLMGVANEIGTGSRIYENYVLYIMSKLCEIKKNPERLKSTQEKMVSYNETATKLFKIAKSETEETPTWGSGPKSELLRSGNYDSLKTESSKSAVISKKPTAAASKNSSAESESSETKRVSSTRSRRSTKMKRNAEKPFVVPTEAYETEDSIRFALMSDAEIEGLSSRISSDIEIENSEGCGELLGI
jgi:hypothetical protein